MPALTGGGLMFGLGVCSAIAVFLPMALLPRSRRLLRRTRFVLAGAALGALAMAIHDWPGAIHGPLLQRLRYVDTFDVISYGLTVFAAGGLGLASGLAFHTVFRLSLHGGAVHATAPPPGEGA